ncbi:MAG: flagellar biosynthetic protein FliO [Archangium sp.]|nr:flagellar biosynthetic protein FliO [Archangium sp.]
MLRLPVLLLFISLTSAPAARAEERPPEPTIVVPAAEPSALPRDEAGRLAEPEIPKSEPPDLAADEFSLGWTLVRTMIVLAMVVALAYLTLNVGLRRLLGIRAPVGTSVVTVLERVALDQKRSLFVVEAGGEVLLIGGGESALTLITKLDRAEVDKLKASTPASPIQLSPLLRRLLGRKDAPPTAPDPGQTP